MPDSIEKTQRSNALIVIGVSFLISGVLAIFQDGALLGYLLIVATAIVVCAARRIPSGRVGLRGMAARANLPEAALFLLAIFASPPILQFFGCFAVLAGCFCPGVFIGILSAVMEEFLFRCYLQSELLEWAGKWKAVFCLRLFFHLPQRILAADMSPMQAMASCVQPIPAALLPGISTILFKNIDSIWLRFIGNMLIYKLN
ncbi:MAG: type II CAAX prenyl endopeptidase Rce1 family protein [Christensenellaceae bacterium]|jgi:hypothetical protein